jgi:hypothetical protein
MKYLLLTIAIICCAPVAQAQDFKARQKAQEKAIEKARKAKKISDNEYNKLMEAQQVIKNTMIKYELDNVWTPEEKNRMHDKLVREEKRLKRYQTNGEIY